MGIYESVFNGVTLYNTLFFNIKGVLEYPNLDELKKNRIDLYSNWMDISKKYNLQLGLDSNVIYQHNAVYYPEFCKIVAITYATVYFENNKIKRSLKKIVDNSEIKIIESFTDILHNISTDGNNSTPKYFPILSGHEIINYDIPLLIKRYFKYKDNFKSKSIPLILKNALNVKPWESNVIIDTINVWRFNGGEYSSINLISDFLGLKKGDVELENQINFSKKYWEFHEVGKNENEILEWCTLQSATQTNLVIQLLNEIRQI